MEANPKYNKIADVLKQDGRTQKWLADRMGVSANAMNNWCQQKSQPSLERLFNMAEILKVNVFDLINADCKPDGK